MTLMSASVHMAATSMRKQHPLFQSAAITDTYLGFYTPIVRPFLERRGAARAPRDLPGGAGAGAAGDTAPAALLRRRRRRRLLLGALRRRGGEPRLWRRQRRATAADGAVPIPGHRGVYRVHVHAGTRVAYYVIVHQWG